jgi:hypothetical protein
MPPSCSRLAAKKTKSALTQRTALGTQGAGPAHHTLRGAGHRPGGSILLRSRANSPAPPPPTFCSLSCSSAARLPRSSPSAPPTAPATSAAAARATSAGAVPAAALAAAAAPVEEVLTGAPAPAPAAVAAPAAAAAGAPAACVSAPAAPAAPAPRPSAAGLVAVAAAAAGPAPPAPGPSASASSWPLRPTWPSEVAAAAGRPDTLLASCCASAEVAACSAARGTAGAPVSACATRKPAGMGQRGRGGRKDVSKRAREDEQPWNPSQRAQEAAAAAAASQRRRTR